MAVFTNQATLSYNGIVTSSNIVTGELVQVLSVVKTALEESYGVGDTITYAVSIINNGSTDYNGITVTDDLGAYPFGEETLLPLTYNGDVLLYVNGVLQAPPGVSVGPPLVFTIASVPALSSAVLIYSATVNSFAPLDASGSITNTVTLGGGGISSPISDDETINATTKPLLSISKSIFPSSVPENGEISYTFIIENTGNAPADADADVVVTDVFDPKLSNISVALNGEILSSPADYTYNETSGLFQTVPGVITVPAASYVQDPDSGVWNIVPGTAVLTVTGNL